MTRARAGVGFFGRQAMKSCTGGGPSASGRTTTVAGIRRLP
ncbi:hypothetical protein [Enterococcus faecium]